MAIEPADAVDAMMAAIENNDADAMRAATTADVTVWHSFDGVTQHKEENIALLGGLALLGRPSYRVLERIVVGDRVVQRHDFVITTWDNSREYRMSAAMFMTIHDGRIATVEEYADSRDAAEIGAAIAAAAQAHTPVSATA